MKSKKDLIKTYALLLRACGVGGCFYTFGAGALGRFAPGSKMCVRFLHKKHESILRYLEKALAPQIARYAREKAETEKTNGGHLWVFWWQGEENAPPVVKRCLANLRRHALGREIVVVDRENLSRYASLPPFLLERVAAGTIPVKLLSDIVRAYLLRDHGGLWVDACIFLARDIPESYFERPFFSAHLPDDGTGRFVSRSRWTVGLMGGAAGCVFFRYIAECLTAYWQNHDSLINMLLFDYIIEAGARNVPAIRDLTDALPVNNENLYALDPRANEPFDESAYARLSENTAFFRFPWRAAYRDETDSGAESWYGKISRG